MAGAADVKPSLPSWFALAKDENYEIQVTFLPDSKVEKKTTRQIELDDKDCERNGNKTMEKEDANSFFTVECHADGSLLIRRSTLQPIGKLKQELTLTAIGTSRFEVLQGSDYYPDITIKVSRIKVVKPVVAPGGAAPGAKPGTAPSTAPVATPGTAPVATPGAKPSAKP